MDTDLLAKVGCGRLKAQIAGRNDLERSLEGVLPVGTVIHGDGTGLGCQRHANADLATRNIFKVFGNHRGTPGEDHLSNVVDIVTRDRDDVACIQASDGSHIGHLDGLFKHERTDRNDSIVAGNQPDVTGNGLVGHVAIDVLIVAAVESRALNDGITREDDFVHLLHVGTREADFSIAKDGRRSISQQVHTRLAIGVGDQVLIITACERNPNEGYHKQDENISELFHFLLTL